MFSHKFNILIKVVKNIIIKKIIVERLIKSLSLLILNIEIINEKEDEILFGFVKDSINNNADPIVINSKIPLKILINSIPRN